MLTTHEFANGLHWMLSTIFFLGVNTIYTALSFDSCRFVSLMLSDDIYNWSCVIIFIMHDIDAFSPSLSLGHGVWIVCTLICIYCISITITGFNLPKYLSLPPSLLFIYIKFLTTAQSMRARTVRTELDENSICPELSVTNQRAA